MQRSEFEKAAHAFSRFLRGNIKVMVGGAPITEAFAEEIGADGYSDDAASAASLAKKLAA